jgi:hypothetical protein
MQLSRLQLLLLGCQLCLKHHGPRLRVVTVTQSHCQLSIGTCGGRS